MAGINRSVLVLYLGAGEVLGEGRAKKTLEKFVMVLWKQCLRFETCSVSFIEIALNPYTPSFQLVTEMQINLAKRWEKNVAYSVASMLCGVMCSQPCCISSYNFIFCL